jgi:hypothetical protein
VVPVPSGLCLGHIVEPRSHGVVAVFVMDRPPAGSPAVIKLA